MSREKVLIYGIQVFNGELDKLSNWLLKPNPSLGGKTPNDLMGTEEGLKEVKNCLDRIEFGNFS